MIKLKFIILLILVFFKSGTAFAYFGLGPLIPILGSVFWLIFLFLLAFLGIFIKPLKNLYNKLKKKKIDKKDKQLPE